MQQINSGLISVSHQFIQISISLYERLWKRKGVRAHDKTRQLVSEERMKQASLFWSSKADVKMCSFIIHRRLVVCSIFCRYCSYLSNTAYMASHQVNAMFVAGNHSTLFPSLIAQKLQYELALKPNSCRVCVQTWLLMTRTCFKKAST